MLSREKYNIIKAHVLMLWTAFKLTIAGIIIIVILFALFFLQAMIAQRIVDHNQAEVDRMAISLLANDVSL